MVLTLPLLSYLTFGGALIALIVAVAALRERPDPLAHPIAVLMIGVAIWGTGQAASFAVTSPQTVVYLEQAQFLGIVLVPLYFFIVVCRYVGFDLPLRRRYLGIISIVPIITLALVATNSRHELFWADISITTVAGATVMVPEHGPWFFVHLVWAYLLVGVGLLALASMILREGPLHRKQALLVFLAGLIPLALNVSHQLGITPSPQLDLTPVAFALAGSIFALAFFRFDLLELRPVAYDHLIEELRDGVAVVSASGMIRAMNPVASQIVEAYRDQSTPPVKFRKRCWSRTHPYPHRSVARHDSIAFDPNVSTITTISQSDSSCICET